MNARKIDMRRISAFLFLLALILIAGCTELKGLADYNESIFNGTGLGILQGNATSSIYGTITGPDKYPLENAMVALISNASNYSALTGADGKYRISGMDEGDYLIVVSKSGYRNATIPKFHIFARYSYPWNVTLASSASSLSGVITNLLKEPLEGAEIMLVGAPNYSEQAGSDGKYNLTGINPGIYTILVQKAGYKNVSFANFTVLEGGTYTWNVSISRDCLYYLVNTSTNYVLKYGFEGTLYQGKINFVISYPQGAESDVYPPSDGRLSDVGIGDVAGNRVLEWELDNLKGSYSYVSGHAYMNIDGTGTMQLYSQKKMSISEAASKQPAYLGSETNSDGKKLVDPSNREIKAIAQRVKNETGSNDTWTVAKALFIWLKNNTVYYIDPLTSNYSHLPTEVLHSGKGKCDELAHLYLSLLRADGIPSRFVKGYFIERNPDRYLSHVWVEFYDGEWVPVEVAGGGNASSETDVHFAIQLPDHVAVFVDDGTSESLTEGDYWTETYYGRPSEFSFSIHYDAIGYGQKYLSVCADGTRELKDERE